MVEQVERYFGHRSHPEPACPLCRNGHKFCRHPTASPVRAEEDATTFTTSLAAASTPPWSNQEELTWQSCS